MPKTKGRRKVPSRLKPAGAGLFGRKPKGEPVRDWGSVAGQPTRWVGYDLPLVWAIVALLSLGLVMVYSASIQLPDNPKFSNYSPTYFVLRHAVSIALAGITRSRGVK